MKIANSQVSIVTAIAMLFVIPQRTQIAAYAIYKYRLAMIKKVSKVLYFAIGVLAAAVYLETLIFAHIMKVQFPAGVSTLVGLAALAALAVLVAEMLYSVFMCNADTILMKRRKVA